MNASQPRWPPEVEELVADQAEWWHRTVRSLGICSADLIGRLGRLLESCDERGDELIRDDASGAIVGVASYSTNSWTGLREGYLYALGPLSRPDMAVRSVTTWARRRTAETGIRLWRAEVVSGVPRAVASILEGSGWLRHYDVTVIRLPKATDVGVPDGLVVREAAEEDWPFVANLLFEAVWNSLFQVERVARTRASVRRVVRNEYHEGLRTGSTFSFVATGVDGRRLGHATGRVLDRHAVLGLVEGELVDTSTLASAQGQGLGWALSAAALRELSARGAEVCFGTVELIHTPKERLPAIRHHLALHGWQTFSTFWLLVP